MARMTPRWSLLVLWAAVVPTAAASDTRLTLDLQVCDTSAKLQVFAWKPLPANMTPAPGEQQLTVAAQHTLPTACTRTGSSTNANIAPTSCTVNVEAWGTHAGDAVWVVPSAAAEPIAHEENRVWILQADGALYNPASHLCADADRGTAAAPGAAIVLTTCGTSTSSAWVYSEVDGTVSQQHHSGSYPGLCITAHTSSGPAPPSPPSPPPPPFPPSMPINLTVDGGNQTATSSAMMVSWLMW